ncbi:Msx2-interacting protein [Liparis tanakae]|uniref:Msx2-interacting protein n=1 Tax=Liparis tanakae TaxID=230148 RepID=A0A4Z2EYF1_9TELE|nr:Msx2-interacting protein [Liparis tanakae]
MHEDSYEQPPVKGRLLTGGGWGRVLKGPVCVLKGPVCVLKGPVCVLKGPVCVLKGPVCVLKGPVTGEVVVVCVAVLPVPSSTR